MRGTSIYMRQWHSVGVVPTPSCGWDEEEGVWQWAYPYGMWRMRIWGGIPYLEDVLCL